MIHTKEPANVTYVYLTAFRSFNPLEVNTMLLKGMISIIRKFPGQYGNIESDNVTDCYQEEGAESPSVERTLKVRCTKPSQVAALTYLACHSYDQDSVLMVTSQTHTAHLASIKMQGEYPMSFPEYHKERLGVFTKQDTGASHYSIIEGERWEVA